MGAHETASLYDRDFFEWTTQVARLLREGRFTEVDVEHLAEEIEDVGKRDKRGVEGHLRIVLLHLLKWQGQSQKRSRSWRASIRTHRIALSKLFKDSPSLRRHDREVLGDVFAEAVGVAMDETGLPRECFPAQCPYTFEQIMNFDFLPE
jgi:hypothetical protein